MTQSPVTPEDPDAPSTGMTTYNDPWAAAVNGLIGALEKYADASDRALAATAAYLEVDEAAGRANKELSQLAGKNTEPQPIVESAESHESNR